MGLPARVDLGRSPEARELKELRSREAWKQLGSHYAEIEPRHLRELFDEDPGRGERLIAEGAGLFLDYSKHRVTDETLKLLCELAIECGWEQRRDAMFAGEHINVSEDRAVLHVALRMPKDRSLMVDGVDVVKQVHETLDRMGAFTERVRSGSGPATRASRSAMSSTSGSAARTSAP